MEAETIIEVVNKLVGEIHPFGASHIDDLRLSNLKVLCRTVEQLVVQIDNIAYKYKDRQEYSIKEAGIYADNFITKTLGISNEPKP